MEPRRRFRFLKRLAEGSFGKVYLAEMLAGDNFSTVVAIKLLHARWLKHDEIVMRSRDEARLLGLLRHRHIVRVEDLTSINGQCAVVMEYLEGVDLETLSNTLKEQGRRISRRAIFEILAAISSALHAAYNHRPLQGGEPLRVIHRDIKPSNVMLTDAGEVKVLDFGTAQASFFFREAETEALFFGSQAYMAPERMIGDPDTTAGDIFSLGVTMYELLAQERFGRIYPHRRRHEESLAKRLDAIDLGDQPPELARAVLGLQRQMLAYDPEDRPSARELVETFEEYVEQSTDTSLRKFCRLEVRRVIAQKPPSHDDPLTGSTFSEDPSSQVYRTDSDGDEPESSSSDSGPSNPPVQEPKDYDLSLPPTAISPLDDDSPPDAGTMDLAVLYDERQPMDPNDLPAPPRLDHDLDSTPVSIAPFPAPESQEGPVVLEVDESDLPDPAHPSKTAPVPFFDEPEVLEADDSELEDVPIFPALEPASPPVEPSNQPPGPPSRQPEDHPVPGIAEIETLRDEPERVPAGTEPPHRGASGSTRQPEGIPTAHSEQPDEAPLDGEPTTPEPGSSDGDGSHTVASPDSRPPPPQQRRKRGKPTRVDNIGGIFEILGEYRPSRPPPRGKNRK